MIDRFMRGVKNALLRGSATLLSRHVSALSITVAAFAVGVAAVIAAAAGAMVTACVLWLANRILDGIDGEVARIREESSDLGGYVDMLGDAIVYAALPATIALHRGDPAFTMSTLVMVAAFYGNLASWMYLSAILEKRQQTDPARTTSIDMPSGLMEGTETIVLYTALLLIPSWGVAIALIGALGGAVGIVQRLVWAVRTLGSDPGD